MLRIRFALTTPRRVSFWQQPGGCRPYQNDGRTTAHYFSTSSSSSSSSNSSSISEKFNLTKHAGVSVLLVIGGGVVAARFVYGSLLDREAAAAAAQTKNRLRKDDSKATVLLQHVPSTTKPTKPILTPNNLRFQQVDAAHFADFVTQQRALLQQARKVNEKKSTDILHTELEHALAECSNRTNDFVDWYLAYPTTYKLLSIAVKSAMKHAVTIRRKNKEQQQQSSLSQAVSQDLQIHVSRKYEALVLRPALTDPKIHRALVRSLHQAHDDYRQAVTNLDESVSHFAVEQQHNATPQYYHHYYASPPSAKDVIVQLDWTAQLQKVQHIPVAYEKNPEMTVALVTAGAVTGKVAGGAATVGATKALVAKLVAPFASKAAASAITGKAAAGGALLGAPLGGAVGAAAGAAIGIGVDMGVNLGVGLMQRSDLQRDVQESLRATMQEWEEMVLRPELQRVQAIWYDHAEALLIVQEKADADEKAQKSPSVRPNKEIEPT